MQTNTLEKNDTKELLINELFDEIEQIIVKNKTKMIYQINNTLINTYFTIGKVIIENE